ncbi:MAG: HesA/MoeB/ThiF family protein [bacterium]
MAMPEIGEAGQKRLCTAKVAIAGVGGLGCTLARCLSGAGVGEITLIDDGEVELSNLNRQFLYGITDVGKSKAEIAKHRLSENNPTIRIETICARINTKNADQIFSKCDMIFDCLDNFETRFILNETAIRLEKTLIHGACRGFEGRIMTIIPHRTPCLQCTISSAPEESKVPILGSTAVFVASLQASEGIRLIAGHQPATFGKMLFAYLSNMSFEMITVPKDPECRVCGSSL